jgi:hypothetical protein
LLVKTLKVPLGFLSFRFRVKVLEG